MNFETFNRIQRNPIFQFREDGLRNPNNAKVKLPLIKHRMHGKNGEISVLPFKKRRRFRRFVNIMEPSMPITERRSTQVMYLTGKKVTQSDADRNQHRLQLTAKDVLESGTNELVALGRRAMDLDQPLDVNVRDRMGNAYKMVFKYVASSGTFRLMGPGYTDFLMKSGLRQGQLIDIWGSSANLGGAGSEIWIMLINYDE